MAVNTIEFAKKYVPVLDAIYKAGAVTEGLDTGTKVDFTGTNEVKVLKCDVTGLGDYDRDNGYAVGGVTAAWETLKLATERSKEFSVDRMDSEEAANVFGTVSGMFVAQHVVPELDAYRFAKYASATGATITQAELVAENIIGAIDEGVRVLDENEVPDVGRILYVNTDIKPRLNAAVKRKFGSDATISTVLKEYNDIQIRYVPKKRFYSAIELHDGASTWGYSKATGATGINFMLIHPQSVLQTKKLAIPKIFTPDENQKKDAWLYQFRLYHDAFVYENKAAGIYVHKATT